jgi:hypothetical protein
VRLPGAGGAAGGDAAAGPGVRGPAPAPAGVPQLPQNLKPGCMGVPQAAQASEAPAAGAAGLSGWPQSRQKAKEGSFSRPQRAHLTGFDIPPFRHAAGAGSTRRPRGRPGV